MQASETGLNPDLVVDGARQDHGRQHTAMKPLGNFPAMSDDGIVRPVTPTGTAETGRVPIMPVVGLHRRTPSRTALDQALQLEDTRVLSNDWVIRYDTRYLLLARQSHQAPARSTVLVRENAAGAIELRYRGRVVRWREIPAPPVPSPRPPAARPPARIAAPCGADPALITRGAVATTNARSGRSRRGARNDTHRPVDAAGVHRPSPGDISVSVRTGTFLFRFDTTNPDI